VSKLSPQMEKLLGLMRPGEIENVWTVEEKFYGMPRGSFGYVHAGRGRGSGSLRNTFEALERRGLVEKVSSPRAGWRKVEQAVCGAPSRRQPPFLCTLPKGHAGPHYFAQEAEG
jgi:hypothetical protein